MAANDDKAIAAEYREKKPLYERLCREVVVNLEELVKESGIALEVPLASRVKSLNSVLTKAKRMGPALSSLTDMHDLAGVRLVVMFKRDAERVCELIGETFDVIKEEDTEDRLSADQFGYGSIHIEVKPHETWLFLPTWKNLGNMPTEIQIRTVTQHIWAGASHLLQYKRKKHVPVPVRRAINRVAALLELVDLEFERVLMRREEYRTHLTEIGLDEPLNTELLRGIFERFLPAENADDEEPLAELVDQLSAFGVTKGRDLVGLLEKHQEAMNRAEALAVKDIKRNGSKSEYRFDPERLARGVFLTHVGLVQEALSRELGAKFDDYIRSGGGALTSGA